MTLLQINVTEANRGLVFGSYSCIAKNQYGYVTETVKLEEVSKYIKLLIRIGYRSQVPRSF